jgi:hypothetical protein
LESTQSLARAVLARAATDNPELILVRGEWE